MSTNQPTRSLPNPLPRIDKLENLWGDLSSFPEEDRHNLLHVAPRLVQARAQCQKYRQAMIEATREFAQDRFNPEKRRNAMHRGALHVACQAAHCCPQRYRNYVLCWQHVMRSTTGEDRQYWEQYGVDSVCGEQLQALQSCLDNSAGHAALHVHEMSKEALLDKLNQESGDDVVL